MSGLTVGFFSAGRVARGDRFRATSYDMSQAIIVNFIYSSAMKAIVKRERPNHSNHLSFPSGHASNAFAVGTVVGRHYGWKLGVPTFAVASYIAISRVAANDHHLSDVVAGAALGFGVGRAVVRRNGRPPNAPNPPKSNMALCLDGGPASDGIGLRFAIDFR